MLLTEYRKTVRRLGGSLTKRILERKETVIHGGRPLFTLRNFGHMTLMRTDTFSTKEPETIAWIDGFEDNCNLLDIGANIGVYSLYAALGGHNVRCIEPDALNFALLNLNIADNGLGDRIIAYPFSIHSESKIAELNVGQYRWGGAKSSFDRSVDWTGGDVLDGFAQGSPGITVDDFVAETGFFPNHIKVDVDGNELLVLRGAQRTLSDPRCTSLLIELYPEHKEYEACLEIIGACNLDLRDEGARAEHKPVNFIFEK